MKRVFFVATIALIGNGLLAQESYSNKSSSGGDNFKLGVAVEPSLPVGHFHDLAGFGFGGALQGEYMPKKVGVTFSVGYLTYSGKTVDTISYGNFKYWPIMGGLKLRTGEKAFLHGQLGAGIGEKGLGTSFWYGAGVGMDISRAFGLELKYTGWKQNLVNKGSSSGYGGGTGGGGGGGGGGYGGHYSTIGLNVAYNFVH